MSIPVAISKGRTGYLVVLFSLFLVFMVLFSLSSGYIKIPFLDILQLVFGKISGNLKIIEAADETFMAVLFDVRLPRILTCAFVGAALALSGVLFQGILLNLGAAFVSVPVFAFAGACITLFVVVFLSYSSKNPMAGLSSNNLILSGIIVAAILSAGISFLKFIANEQVSVIIFWLMGSFASKTWANVAIVMIFTFSGLFISVFFARDLNLISLGAKSANSLGVDLKKVTLILLITGSLVAAVCVSVSGIIGFVGLLIPHMIRFVTGPDNRKLIPLSMLAGASLLLFADTITRAVLPHEIPIGVLTALTGGPVFCWIFKKNKFK